MAVQGIVGRNVPPSQAAVLSVGHIAAGTPGSPNVIPSEVLISGTARSFSADVRDLLERRLAEVAAGIAQAGGCTAESKYLRRYPALVNSVEQTSLAVEAAAMTVGRENVDPNTPRISGAEDFAFMLEKKPGAYIMIGNGGTGRRRLPQRPFAALRLQRPHPDDGRGLLGQPGAARAGRRGRLVGVFRTAAS